ncbi:MAG: 30S ribosomal protein S20 [Alphaproteobacteria bacterium]|nr:30S ribosomal protein S20 [Alphaproteobacteria bacterium]
MANLKSAKTRIRRNNKRAIINSNRLNAVRTEVKKTRKAIAAGDKDAAVACFKSTESLMARAASRGTVHKNTAARKISRLAAAIKAMVAKA